MNDASNSPPLLSRRSVIGTVATSAVLMPASVPGQAIDRASATDRHPPAPDAAAVSPLNFGAKGDGRHDDTAAFQACADTGRPILVPPGTYLITRPIELFAGQRISGAAATISGDGATSLVNDVPGSGCLWFTRYHGGDQRGMPVIANLRLRADHPIRFNDPETGRVAEGGASNIPYGMRPAIINCAISARKAGLGVGIAWTKMFDGVIEGCEIIGFSINLLLLGCDLNAVRGNRSMMGHRFHILELSVGTFGAQNLIEHNDILVAGSPDCIFIKTTARHARIRDNYLEHGGGGPDGGARSFTGFIDASAVRAPRIGANAVGERFTTVIRDNRIDGASYVTDFVYRYQPEGQTYGEIVDPGTTGDGPRGSARYLRLVDASGADIDRLPFVFNQINLSAFHFRSPGFGHWNGYQSSSIPGRLIDGRTFSMFGASTIYGNRADRYFAARGNLLVVLPGFTSQARLAFGSDAPYLAAGQSYVAQIVARSVGGPETLTIGRLEGDAGADPILLPLSETFRRFNHPLTFSATANPRRGIYIERSDNGRPIEIESITLELR